MLLATACFDPPINIDPIDAEPGPMIDAGPDAPDAEPGPDAMAPDAMLDPALLTTTATAHDFGDVAQGGTSGVYQVYVRNSGQVASSPISISLEGANAADFEIVPTGDASDCSGATLDPDTTCKAQVRFHPAAVSNLAATLVVSATDGGSVRVDVSGNGLSPGALMLVTTTPLDFATIKIGSTSATQTVTVHNTGDTATGSLTVSFDSTNYTAVVDGCGGAPLPATSDCSVQLRFNPTKVDAIPTQLSIRESPTAGVSLSVSGTGAADLQVSKGTTGRIVSDVAGLDCGTGCTVQTGTFTTTPIQLTATPDAGYIFDGWTGACAGANPSNVCSVPLTQALTSTAATFTQVFRLDVSVTGTGAVTSAPVGITCGSAGTDCDQDYVTGTMVTLTAEPAAGFEVFSWSGAACGVGVHTCQVTMNQARTVAIEFRRQYTLTASTNGSGAGTIAGGGISCSPTCTATLFQNDVVNLGATPAAAGTGYQHVFTQWGGACNGAGACQVTMDGDKDVSATFTKQYQLSVGHAGAGGGTVTGTGGFSCAAGTCTRFYDSGTAVSLSAAPNAGSAFAAYGGDCSGGSCNLTMNAAHSVTATFNLIYRLTVAVTGGGVVTSNPAGITCGTGNTDCTEDYTASQSVALTATPDPGYEVFSWSIAGCTAGMHMCSVDMTQARNVSVVFKRQYTLTVSTMGSGTGLVTGGSISCPGTCTQTVFADTTINLAETPTAAGSGYRHVFTQWGGACNGTGACQVTLDADKNVSATFTKQYQLTATATGSGTGSLSDGAGFTCARGNACSQYYDSGMNVSLATSGLVSTSFDGFTGDCAGAACTLTMSAAHSVTGTFHAWQCTPSTTICDDPTSHYVECGADGLPAVEMNCPLRCATGIEKCLDVEPSNGYYSYLEGSEAAPALTFDSNTCSAEGACGINTDTGVIQLGQNTAPMTGTLDAAVRIYSLSSLRIEGTVKVTGASALAFMVNGDVTITGTLDISADGATGGPGAASGAGCVGGSTSSATIPNAGAGGGGRYFSGRNGGNTGTGTAGGQSGSGGSSETPIPLAGGCGGGTTAVGNGPGAARAYGGGGGGAVQITSRGTIAVTGNGVIDASGGGGRSTDSPIAPADYGGGGGAGAGGSILLEGNVVAVDGAGVVLSTKGGGGAGVGSHNLPAHGADGGTAAAAAAGGATSGYPTGGVGALGSTAGGNGQAGTGNSGAAACGGGGGGSIGIARFNSTFGTTTVQNGAAVRSHVSSGTLATRQLPQAP
ncbi:MAG: choice-of-anchor D domain-containing protein [Myxococcales bacterium]|nr:choice-of-anchor D domain-containing protein [Myxococcales bacterium]